MKDGWEKLCTNKQTNKQTDRQTDRHYENNGHLAVNQYTHIQCRNQQVNRRHIKLTYLLTAPEPAQGRLSTPKIIDIVSYLSKLLKQVVKVIWRKGRIAAVHGWFSCICQIAPMCTTIYTQTPPESTTQTTSRLVQPFFHSSRQKVPILYNAPALPPQNCPCAWGSGLPSNTCFLRPTPLSVPNGISISSEVFTPHSRSSLYLTMGNPSPQNCPLAWRIWTPI